VRTVAASEVVLPRPVSFPVRSRQGRRILVATVLGAGIAGIDASVVTVALPEIGRDLGASFVSLQWTVSGYTLSLASLILLTGGSFSPVSRFSPSPRCCARPYLT
jgi:hypothetical protein